MEEGVDGSAEEMGIGTGKEEMVVIAGEVGEAEEGKGKGGSGGMARGGDKRGWAP